MADSRLQVPFRVEDLRDVDPIILGRFGHQLHQAFGPFMGNGPSVKVGLGLDNGLDQLRVHSLPLAELTDLVFVGRVAKVGVVEVPNRLDHFENLDRIGGGVVGDHLPSAAILVDVDIPPKKGRKRQEREPEEPSIRHGDLPSPNAVGSSQPAGFRGESLRPLRSRPGRRLRRRSGALFP
ncbi:MAG: hypothetical protein BWY86_00842 [Candidatus Aminicenantes bacterium ADurb.Bin508]|nr:MAG: hypothetical protein BWY86_00842 [Candidatus Aminicenantes bacterium ADurb.Bin508]